MRWPIRTALLRSIPLRCMAGGMPGCDRKRRGRRRWRRADGATAAVVLGTRAVVGVDILAAVEGIQAAAGNNPEARSPTRIGGRLLRMTLRSLPQCWTNWEQSFRWMRHESMRLAYRKADS